MSSIPRLPTELTVGHVAGIIAAGLVVVRFLCPAVLTYILAGLLRDTETASTWTVASANLAPSIWTLLLRTDSSGAGSTVRTIIKIVCKCIPLLALLCAITGVVTPLGLGEELTTLPERVGTFEYVRDESAYGQGTTARGQYQLSRVCVLPASQTRANRLAACPYSNTEVIFNEDDEGFTVELPNGYNTSIPELSREIYTSGTPPSSTVSNFYDIEWRQLTTRNEMSTEDVPEYPVGMFRHLDSFILENRYKLAEGLVIDAKIGGIGFRNHTIPVGMTLGATWSEDLLFIEPSTTCVNTNVTLDFEVITDYNRTARSGVNNVVLTDRGGFSQMNSTLPSFDNLDGQVSPDLVGRAYKAAWLNNAFTMLYMNVTNEKDKPVKGMKSFSYMNSEPGKQFPIPLESFDDYKSLRFSENFGDYLHLDPFNATSTDEFPNPFNISRKDFDAIHILCSGTGPADNANITNIYTGCALLRGAPQRVDGGPPLLFENRSKWSTPLHACASALRATIKTVVFSINGTTLDDLVVQSITPKTYASPEDAPLWGMEDFPFPLGNHFPVWGLIAPEYASRDNVASIRKPDFYLPGYSADGLFTPMIRSGVAESQNLAGASFAQTTMNAVLKVVAKGEGEWPFDMRGAASMAIFRRWQELSKDAARAGEIVDLLWTDLAASAVVGTRSTNGPFSASPQSQSQPQGANIMVQPVGKRITYDIRFGIPAFFLIVWLGVILLMALLSTCCCGGRGGFKSLRRRIEQLSVGRVFTTYLYPDQSTLTMPARQWRAANGEKMVSLGVGVRRGDAEDFGYRGTQGQGDEYGLIEGLKR
ncbi:hypothetical protein OQA88_6673 [Cercophora sp. LCS_1]